jgi:hypothetical protein
MKSYKDINYKIEAKFKWYLSKTYAVLVEQKMAENMNYKSYSIEPFNPMIKNHTFLALQKYGFGDISKIYDLGDSVYIMTFAGSEKQANRSHLNLCDVAVVQKGVVSKIEVSRFTGENIYDIQLEGEAGGGICGVGAMHLSYNI